MLPIKVLRGFKNKNTNQSYEILDKVYCRYHPSDHQVHGGLHSPHGNTLCASFRQTLDEWMEPSTSILTVKIYIKRHQLLSLHINILNDKTS